MDWTYSALKTGKQQQQVDSVHTRGNNVPPSKHTSLCPATHLILVPGVGPSVVEMTIGALQSCAFRDHNCAVGPEVHSPAEVDSRWKHQGVTSGQAGCNTSCAQCLTVTLAASKVGDVTHRPALGGD